MVRTPSLWQARQIAIAVIIVSHAVTPVWAWPWTPRKATFPQASQVAKIGVSVTAMPSGVTSPAPSVRDKKQIKEVLNILANYRDGWKKIFLTQPAGRIQVNFISPDTKSFWPLCTIRIDTGWISTDIDGCHCSRAMSPKDQKRLLKALSLDSSLLDKAKN